MTIEWTYLDNLCSLEIDQQRLIRRLGYPRDYDLPEGVVRGLKKMHQWYQIHGKPWLTMVNVKVRYKDENLIMDDKICNAPKLLRRYRNHHVTSAIILCATAGHNVDVEIRNLWENDQPDFSYYLDMLAALVTEGLIAFGADQVHQWALRKGMDTLSRYSPGYPGWDLSEQKILMGMLKKYEGVNIPVNINDSMLLTPLKSQISVIGLTTNEINNKTLNIKCLECTFDDCECRKTRSFV